MLPSDGTWAMTEALNSLQQAWRASGRRAEMAVLDPGELPGGTPPGALVTLGSAALKLVQARAESGGEWARVPVLAALIPRDGFLAVWRRPPPWVSAVFLDQPPERYLELIRRVFPRSTRVGVLIAPDDQASQQALRDAAVERGLQLTAGVVPHPAALYGSLRAVLSESDVLLVLPDAEVADAAAVQRMLMAAYRQRVPVVGYSPAMVRAGAALGLYATPAQVGRQVASILKMGTSAPNWPASRMSEGFVVSSNEQVCRSLGLDVPDVAGLAEAMRRQEVAK